MVLNGDLRLFHLTINFLQFKQTVQTPIRRRLLWRLMWFSTVCQCPSTKPSPGFTDNSLYTAPWRHSDKNSAAINNCYLYSLVNNKHVNNNLKESLGVCKQSTQKIAPCFERILLLVAGNFLSINVVLFPKIAARVIRYFIHPTLVHSLKPVRIHRLICVPPFRIVISLCEVHFSALFQYEILYLDKNNLSFIDQLSETFYQRYTLSYT